MRHREWPRGCGEVWLAGLLLVFLLVGLQGTGAIAQTSGKIGQRIQDEFVEFTIHRVEWHKALKAGGATVTSKGEFLAVYLRAENAANVGNRSVTPETVILVDGQNRRIDRAPEAERIVVSLHPGHASMFERKEIWPNLRVDGWVVFDVPKGATGLRLLVKGMPASKGKLIDLETR
ncbi:MAG TPA: DUF4352 domain-containing protein [Candidatus Methylomirabilis sp.]